MNSYDAPVKFAKMHGAGNDYVYVVALDEVPADLPDLARCISDRHFGVGGDGLVVVTSSDKADFRMRMFNNDGSEAQMCGNAVRCIAKLVYEKGLTRNNPITLETKAGIRVLQLTLDHDRVRSVRVDMGAPVLKRSEVPVATVGDGPMIGESISLDGRDIRVTAVSMGNPHGVVYVDSITDGQVLGLGPKLENHPVWPERANIEFARVINRREVEMRVWERGSGETLACGTGACATVVAGVLAGVLDREATVHLRGGDLNVEWCEADGHVYLTGPATLVAEGVYYRTHKD